MMGGEGLATQVPILSANYRAKRVEGAYPILYRGAKGRVAPRSSGPLPVRSAIARNQARPSEETLSSFAEA